MAEHHNSRTFRAAERLQQTGRFMEIVYVIHNPEMPGLVKIGKTTKPIEARVRELDNTGIPVPFECLAAWEVEDAEKAGKAIHKAFGDRRVRKGIIYESDHFPLTESPLVTIFP